MQNIINGLPIAAVILLLAVGFAFLVKGADFFVEVPALRRSLRFRPSSLVLRLWLWEPRCQKQP